eukprot:TRINITY_DN32907_c0_g1_i2.p1 TRINITY_DN32907_c0_g1~~TRINITY_DN32907_c0_g1_i2.p1  ORF type:complete len:437 (-),score=92.02 TRINITY_DN32907_c0_g1_i2:468-1712(-)
MVACAPRLHGKSLASLRPRRRRLTSGQRSASHRPTDLGSLTPPGWPGGAPGKRDAIEAWLPQAQAVLPALDLRVLLPPKMPNVQGEETQLPPLVVFGARHDDKDAAKQVAAAIAAWHPRKVALELCDRRFRRFFPGGVDGFVNLPEDTKASLLRKLARGEEQLQAALAARACGSDIVLCDRDVRISEARLLVQLPPSTLVHSACLAFGLPDVGTIVGWSSLGWQLRQYFLRQRGSLAELAAARGSLALLPPPLLSRVLEEADILTREASLQPGDKWTRMKQRMEAVADEALAAAKGDSSTSSSQQTEQLEELVQACVVKERDTVIADRLWTLRGQPAAAVVGVAHLPGLQQRWSDLVAAGGAVDSVAHFALAEEKRRALSLRAKHLQYYPDPMPELWRRLLGKPLLWRLKGLIG